MKLLARLAGSFWVRLVVSIGLLALVATRVDFGRAARRLADGQWEWFALAVLALVAASVVASFRWHLYLEACEVERDWRRVLRAYFAGAFTSNFLPSQVGGDVARALMVGQRGKRVRAFTTVVLDRATALACLIAIAWVFAASDPGGVPRSLLLTLAAVSALFAALVIALLVAAGSHSPIRRRLPARLKPLAGEVLTSLRASVRRRVLVRTLLLGLLFQGLGVLAAWLIGLSIGLSVPVSALVTTLPLVITLSLLPFSIGGLGVREGGFVVLLAQAGVSATEATVFSLLNGLAFALASLPGALVLLRGSRPAAADRVPPRS
ncbi:MAG: lysylphosphatidylglycerol synthase transmembrane domain-containing protein [Gaiellaceae bacterium]